MPSSGRPDLANQRFVVTGAGGFIGSHLVRHLVEAGGIVTAVVRPESSTWRLRDLLQRIELVPCDLDDEARPLVDVMRGASVVFHLAAAGVSGEGDDAALVRTNVLGTLRVLEAATGPELRRFVYCGSCFEYGSGNLLREDAPPRPATAYAASKTAGGHFASVFARRHDISMVWVRPFTVYGPFEAARRLVPYSILAALGNLRMRLTGGEQTRDFLYVDDAVEGLLLAAVEPRAAGTVLNLATGEETSVRHVIDTVVRLTDCSAVPDFGAVPYREAELFQLSGDTTKSEMILGWRATTDLEDGLSKTVAWYRENRGLYAGDSSGLHQKFGT